MARIKHAHVVPSFDDADPDLVDGDDWNADHTLNVVEEETPTGTIDGANDTFTLSQTPSPVASLKLYRNGLLQLRGTHFNISGGNSVVYTAGNIPQSGDWHRAWYAYDA